MDKWNDFNPLILMFLKSRLFISLQNSLGSFYKYSQVPFYSKVQHNMILHMVPQWLRQTMHQRFIHKKHPIPYPHLSFVRIWVKIDWVIIAQHCNSLNIEDFPYNFNPMSHLVYLQSILGGSSYWQKEVASYVSYEPHLHLKNDTDAEVSLSM